MDRDPQQQRESAPSGSKYPRLSIETQGYTMKKESSSDNTWVWQPKTQTPRCTLRHDPFPLWKNRTTEQDQNLKTPPSPPSKSDDQEYDPAHSEQQFSAWKDSWEAKMAKAVADGLELGDQLIELMRDSRSPSPDVFGWPREHGDRHYSLPEIAPFTYYEPIMQRCDSAPPRLEQDGDTCGSSITDQQKFLRDQPEVIVKFERGDVFISVKQFKPTKSQPVRIRIE